MWTGKVVWIPETGSLMTTEFGRTVWIP
jgi:hypothetical protein